MDTYNLLTKEWVTSCAAAHAAVADNALIVRNESDETQKITLKGRFTPQGKFGFVSFSGEVTKGNAPAFLQGGDDESDVFTTSGRASLNSRSVFQYSGDVDPVSTLKLAPHSEARIEKLCVDFFDEEQAKDEFLLSSPSSDILVVTPDYPAPENKYLCGFVHSRLRSYREHGLSFETICCQSGAGACRYEHEGIEVLRTSHVNLRTILRRKQYSKILVHFFDPKIALVFDSCDLHGAELYLWCHNPETRYWESPKYAAPYFERQPKLSQEQIDQYRLKDEVIKRYNDNPLVNWVFISEIQKLHSEEDIGITFNRAHVIPNVVDETMFPYHEKDPDLRKKILILRRFDNLSSYAIDTCVRTIIELSRRPCFDDMEFNVYGTGDFYQQLVEPLRAFDNVHLNPYFLTHSEIARAHQENGIALFPTRYDSQGVSAGEAAMSGMAVVSSSIDATEHFLPNDKGLLAEPDNYLEHADIIERMYNDPDYFIECCQACHDKTVAMCGTDKTTALELELIRRPQTRRQQIRPRPQASQPVLSIVIPSYNVSDYLSHGVSTLMNQEHADLLDIVIVNDGSKDDTAQIARQLMETYNDPKAPIIKLIDKENGGHGSTINAGLEQAVGTYFKVMDADDWFDTKELERLLDVLKEETSDIVVMDYSEDKAIPSELIPQHLYDFMVPGLQYRFDDVCTGAYGFSEFGPIIATGCFKTSMLQKTGFSLSEHCFYVDVEFDLYSIVNATTITYRPLNVYRYFIGRDGQSISKSSFIKNQKDHQKIIGNVLSYLKAHPELSPAKRSYVINNLIIPITKTHYMIVGEWCSDADDFTEFDRALSQWPEIYHHSEVATRFVKFHRKTNGKLLGLNPILLRFNEWQKQVLEG